MSLFSKRYRRKSQGACVPSSGADWRYWRNMPATYPAPDPRKWSLLRQETVEGASGPCTVMLVHYPDCTNFEGCKIMVYRGRAPAAPGEHLDPHFVAGGKGPVARFAPDDAGWANAIAFAELLANR